MNIRFKDIEKLNEAGVYAIYNKENKKAYIGSSNNFKTRFSTHVDRIKANNHENKYLQYAYNKNPDVFEFRILLVTKEYIKWEQRAFDLFNPFKERGYNICKIAGRPPEILDKEVLKRRVNTFKNTIREAMKYYYLIKDDKIKEEDIPIKYRKLAMSYINKKVWNKGMKYTNTDHLKVPKKKKGSRKKFIETIISKRKPISVYDISNNYIGTWKTIKELLEFSNSLDNNLPTKSKFTVARMNISKDLLLYPGVMKAIRQGTIYKGLYFKEEDDEREYYIHK